MEMVNASSSEAALDDLYAFLSLYAVYQDLILAGKNSITDNEYFQPFFDISNDDLREMLIYFRRAQKDLHSFIQGNIDMNQSISVSNIYST